MALELKQRTTNNLRVSSKKGKTDAVKLFTRYCNDEHNIQLDRMLEIIKNEEEDIYDILADFAGYMNTQNIAGSSQVTYMINLRTELGRLTKIYIRREEFRERVKPYMGKKLIERDGEPTYEDVARIINVMPIKIKLLCMLQICTIRRPGELRKLTPANYDFDKDPVEVTVPPNISKNGLEGKSFLTYETATMLKTFITTNLIREDQPIFDYAQATASSKIFCDNMKRQLPDMLTRMRTGKFKIHLYSMKKFGFSQVKYAVNEDFAKSLKGDKSEYDRLPQTERARLYKEKCEDVLTIFNQDKLRKQINTKNAETSAQILALHDRIKQLETEKDERMKHLEVTIHNLLSDINSGKLVINK